MSNDPITFWGEKPPQLPSNDFYDAWGAGSGNTATPVPIPTMKVLTQEQTDAYWVRNGQITGTAEWKEELRQLMVRFPDIKPVQFNAIAGHIASTDEDGTEHYFDTVESTLVEYRVQNPVPVHMIEKYAERDSKEAQKMDISSRKAATLQFKKEYADYMEACRLRRERIKDATMRRDARIAEVEAEFALLINEPAPLPPIKPF